jgi:hypothetical protein
MGSAWRQKCLHFLEKFGGKGNGQDFGKALRTGKGTCKERRHADFSEKRLLNGA